MKLKILFGLVLLFFLATRLWKITEVPASVYWDEASIGYNAYSVGIDLKDEWGNFLPLHFRAFGEFKLPIYIYSVAPFVKVLGLNALAVRLPAVFYTLGTLVAVYLLVKKLTGNETAATLSSFILGLSPWLFIFSRTGYEATAGLFFFVLATYLFLLIDRNKLFLLFSSISFILSFYSYNSFRIIIPIWLVLLAIYKFKALKERKFWFATIASVFLFALSLIPVYRLYKFDSGGARFAQVEITSKVAFIRNYFTHFSPEFLFIKGDTNSRSQIPGHGELYWFDIPFIIAGLLAIIKSKKPAFYLPVILILLAPIPAALTKESPHALRAILAAPGFAILSAFGVNFLAKTFKKYDVLILGAVVVGYLASFRPYMTDFITKYQTESASDWQYEYKQIFMSQKSGVVTDKYAQPYIFALFYQRVAPSEFRSTVKYNPIDKWGFSLVSSFDGFQFKP